MPLLLGGQGREEQRRAGQAGHGLVGRGREGRQALGRPIFRRFELPSVCVFMILKILDPYVRRGYNNPLYIPRRVVYWPLVLLGGHIASLMIVRLGIGREEGMVMEVVDGRAGTGRALRVKAEIAEEGEKKGGADAIGIASLEGRPRVGESR